MTTHRTAQVRALAASAAFAIIAVAATVCAASQANAQEVVRLGNLKFAHYGAVSYIKEIAPKCGIKVEEHIFAKGPDVMQATKAFIDDKALAEKYVRETIFKGQITSQDFNDAIANSPYSYDVTPEHIQITTDVMVKYGVGKMAKPALAKDWVETDLLNEAKKSLNVK